MVHINTFLSEGSESEEGLGATTNERRSKGCEKKKKRAREQQLVRSPFFRVAPFNNYFFMHKTLRYEEEKRRNEGNKFALILAAFGSVFLFHLSG